MGNDSIGCGAGGCSQVRYVALSVLEGARYCSICKHDLCFLSV